MLNNKPPCDSNPPHYPFAPVALPTVRPLCPLSMWYKKSSFGIFPFPPSELSRGDYLGVENCVSNTPSLQFGKR